MSRHGREMSSVFDLLGTHEPAITVTLGWTWGRSPALMSRVLQRLELGGSTNADDVAGQLESATTAAASTWSS